MAYMGEENQEQMGIQLTGIRGSQGGWCFYFGKWGFSGACDLDKEKREEYDLY